MSFNESIQGVKIMWFEFSAYKHKVNNFNNLINSSFRGSFYCIIC